MSEFYEMPFHVQTYDIDFAGIVSNIVFIRWLEDLRLALMDQAYPLIQALADDVAPILTSTRISYRRPVTITDKLLGRMRVAGLGRVRWRLVAEFTVGGVVHADAEQEGLFVRLSTRQPIAIPELDPPPAQRMSGSPMALGTGRGQGRGRMRRGAGRRGAGRCGWECARGRGQPGRARP